MLATQIPGTISTPWFNHQQWGTYMFKKHPPHQINLMCSQGREPLVQLWTKHWPRLGWEHLGRGHTWWARQLHALEGGRMGQMVRNGPPMKETQVRSLGRDLLEKGMANHSSILAWKIPLTEEPGVLQFMELAESDTIEWLHTQGIQDLPRV